MALQLSYEFELCARRKSKALLMLACCPGRALAGMEAPAILVIDESDAASLLSGIEVAQAGGVSG